MRNDNGVEGISEMAEWSNSRTVECHSGGVTANIEVLYIRSYRMEVLIFFVALFNPPKQQVNVLPHTCCPFSSLLQCLLHRGSHRSVGCCFDPSNSSHPSPILSVVGRRSSMSLIQMDSNNQPTDGRPPNHTGWWITPWINCLYGFRCDGALLAEMLFLGMDAEKMTLVASWCWGAGNWWFSVKNRI